MNQRNKYIDPFNYMDLMELISTFTNELDRRNTKLEGMIGQGRYYSLIHALGFELYSGISVIV